MKNDKEIESQAYKLEAICKYLGGISPSSVRRLIEQGKIKRMMAFRHIIVTKKELDKFLDGS
jgi:hypothetical protein